MSWTLKESGVERIRVFEESGVGCHVTSVSCEVSGVLQQGCVLVKLSVGFHSRSSSAASSSAIISYQLCRRVESEMI